MATADGDRHAGIPRTSRWWGWGDRAHDAPPPAHAVSWLEGVLDGPLDAPRPPVGLDEVRLGPAALASEARAALREVVGDVHVRDDREARVLHAAGKSYPDLVRQRAGDAEGAPDAVVLPGSHAEVRGVLEACAAAGVAVVPFGGGTSVVGGVEPLRGGFDAVVALDLGRMTGLVSLDEGSRTAVLEPGLRGPEAERLLNPRGFTLGHVPQSFEYATVGGFVATRSAGQASTGYGRIDELVLGLRLAAPAAELDLPPLPASAAGPGLRETLVGSEGAFGVITQAALRVAPLPAERRYEAWVFPDFRAGAACFRELEQSAIAPTIARLSDERETEMNLALSGTGGVKGRALDAYLGARRVRGGCLAILGWEGTEATVHARRQAALPVLRDHGAAGLGQGAGRSWERGRFHAPYLRDDLLARGVLVETLETAAQWSDLHELHRAVGDALRRHCPLVACHISHLYGSGASLYFTFLARQDRGGELDQWRRIKADACDAIVAHRGTITHHHAVGRDHAAWMPAEVGEAGVAALHALKRELDPVGILNPGKLIPSVGGEVGAGAPTPARAV
ncbi:FAD-binding oxidoreductase [Conexibacter sp. SYSU D00693]|uniref:FAD-binding oxidoreductase n=1 Tax=Conexibacter sp. SYSU D00693 TaxID=2812560 RepID=UPI00196A8BE6|nr:FAD-binding oxidoreductase [Conexibacter sp. SYSU D00693]